MEPIHGRHTFAPEDFISQMPDNVITNILDRLPLQDAVRTDVLSKTWRFKWNMLTQLVFDEDFVEYLFKIKVKSNQVRIIIGRILLNLTGPITKCVLPVIDKLKVEDDDIRHWILFLSRKGIKDLTLDIYNGTPYKFPTYLFSCLELKHLKLNNCCFHPPPNFHGFPNLLSLYLYSHFEESSVFWEFISKCPLLEILKVICNPSSGKIKLAEIAKLENLKILSLFLCDLDTMNNLHSSSTIFELLASLPKLQELELCFMGCKLVEDGANQRFPTAFFGLKVLNLSRICLQDGIKLSCAFELIRSCPNLQTLEITSSEGYARPSPPIDYNTTEQLQLRNVTFEYMKGSENEVCLLKYLLACCPFLRKIVIRPHYFCKITSDEKLKFACKLMKVRQASPVADIDLS